MDNAFESPFRGRLLSEQVTNPNIIVGRYSYYSGWYHGHGFDDCARYLMPDRDDVDKLRIGSFCSIGTGAVFMMAGNQGHRNDWVSTFPFFYMPEEPAFAGARDAFQSAGDTIVGNDVWIGAEAMIMPSVRIGDGAMIGSRALVTRDVPPYAIVGGNPARVLRALRRDRRREVAGDGVVALADRSDHRRDAAAVFRRYRRLARGMAGARRQLIRTAQCAPTASLESIAGDAGSCHIRAQVAFHVDAMSRAIGACVGGIGCQPSPVRCATLKRKK